MKKILIAILLTACSTKTIVERVPVEVQKTTADAMVETKKTMDAGVVTPAQPTPRFMAMELASKIPTLKACEKWDETSVLCKGQVDTLLFWCGAQEGMMPRCELIANWTPPAPPKPDATPPVKK